jgi:hypothetical protein
MSTGFMQPEKIRELSAWPQFESIKEVNKCILEGVQLSVQFLAASMFRSITALWHTSHFTKQLSVKQL